MNFWKGIFAASFLFFGTVGYASVISDVHLNEELEAKANKADLKPVAFSGSYNDLTDKPSGSGGGSAAGYEVRSNSITGAATGAYVSVQLDGLRFSAIKQSVANYWGIRMYNNTGAAMEVSSRNEHFYSGSQLYAKMASQLANGAEYNPDIEVGDLGYGKEDVMITFIQDWTNMHFYRWTTTVNVNKAIIVVEKLY